MKNKTTEEFEAWFEANKDFMLGTRKISKGDCFFIWQSSRAAIEVPSFLRYSPDGIDYYDADSVDDAIEELGLKMKP